MILLFLQKFPAGWTEQQYLSSGGTYKEKGFIQTAHSLLSAFGTGFKASQCRSLHHLSSPKGESVNNFRDLLVYASLIESLLNHLEVDPSPR